MPVTLSLKDVKDLIKKAENTFRHEECATCECYQGFLIQLELDGDQEIRDYLAALKPAHQALHSCLGCDPCPPGILYANYLRKKPVQRS